MGLYVRIPPGARVLFLVRYRSLRRADHSSRGVLPTAVRHCVRSRNLKNEKALARVGPQLQNVVILIQDDGKCPKFVSLTPENCFTVIITERKLICLKLEMRFTRTLVLCNCSTTAKGRRDGLTSARCCNYSYMCSWWWVELPPETCRASSLHKYNKLYIVASCGQLLTLIHGARIYEHKKVDCHVRDKIAYRLPIH
jgi:hypothetical protein